MMTTDLLLPSRLDRADRSPQGSAPVAVPRPAVGLRGEEVLQNALLAALPERSLAHLRPYLQRVPLRRRQMLQERGVPMSHVYFIERGTVSLICRASGREELEVGALGRGDLLGVSVALGTTRTPHRAVVQVPGEALRVRAEELQSAMDESPTLRALLLAHVQATLVQTAQLILCNTCHGLRQRLARLLLLILDHLDGDEIPLTHGSLSRSLGVRRAGVTTTVGAMEANGLLRRGRGRLTVLDRSGLERTACECHRVIRAERTRPICEAILERGDAPRPEIHRPAAALGAPPRALARVPLAARHVAQRPTAPARIGAG